MHIRIVCVISTSSSFSTFFIHSFHSHCFLLSVEWNSMFFGECECLWRHVHLLKITTMQSTYSFVAAKTLLFFPLSFCRLCVDNFICCLKFSVVHIICPIQSYCSGWIHLQRNIHKNSHTNLRNVSACLNAKLSRCKTQLYMPMCH